MRAGSMRCQLPLRRSSPSRPTQCAAPLTALVTVQEHEIWILDCLGVDVLGVQPQSFLAGQSAVPPPDDPVDAQLVLKLSGYMPGFCAGSGDPD